MPESEALFAKMKGLDVSVAYGLLSEKKWDVQEFRFHESLKGLSESDKDIIRKLNRVADGELSGAGMMFCLYDACRAKDAEENFALFYEAIFYSANTIVYEEFRHGLVLKELNHLVDGKPSFIKDVSSSEVVRDYFMIRSVWNDPYEVLVSFTVGEITNIIMYREAASRVENAHLKQILLNISRDEYRHKTAWRAISKKLVDSSEACRSNYIKAFRKAHFVHQAEVGRYYAKGLADTRDLFGPESMEEIFQGKVALLKEIVGEEIGFDPKELLATQLSHVSEILQGSHGG